jgi:hypothetical protein
MAFPHAQHAFPRLAEAVKMPKRVAQGSGRRQRRGRRPEG